MPARRPPCRGKLYAVISAHIARLVTSVTAALVLAISLFGARPLLAGDVLIFAAASTTEAVSAAAEQFSSTGVDRVRGVFAGSSTLAKQIENGAPADIYLSANPAWMDYLGAGKHIIPASRRDLLANRLMVIAPAKSKTSDILMTEVDILAALGGGRLAMGDPDHVPAGIYARQALSALGLWQTLQDRLIRTADVRVARGEVPLGIVYASDVNSDAGAFDGIRVVAALPAAGHEPIRYAIALVAGRNNSAAQRFLDFLATPEMAALFRRHGFALP